MNTKKQTLTTFQVSRYLNVDLTTVINWCDQGKIKSYRTPGGHRRVQPKDFVEFMKNYRLPLPKDFIQGAGEVKVLVVDDEDEIRKMVAKSFQKHLPDLKVFEARDGFEAGKMLLDVLPDLVILDLMLPGIDGFRVCANIRADERFKNAKVLAVTGQNTPANKMDILKAGADDFLPKPFEVKDLVAKASHLLRLEEAVQ